MPATIVVGGQYGSEGKGKVVALEASRVDRAYVVREEKRGQNDLLNRSDPFFPFFPPNNVRPWRK